MNHAISCLLWPETAYAAPVSSTPRGAGYNTSVQASPARRSRSDKLFNKPLGGTTAPGTLPFFPVLSTPFLGG